MSGVMGNFALKNYDHTVQTAGASHDQGTAFISSTDSESDKFDPTRFPFRRQSAAAPKSHPDEKHASSSSDDDFEVEKDKQRDQAVVQLARKYTNQSTYSGIDINPFAADKDSILDPQSVNFKPRAWTKALLNLQAKDPDNFKERTAGFAFRDLNVHGYGSATDYQKTVANVILQGWGLVRKLMGAKERRIDILKGLDGIVHSGEMLVVLGPPGSGCTTFLKTISGETHGFFVDDGSYINYQGISSKQFHRDFRGEAIYTAEVDVHFPQLSVGNTLMFAAWARSPRKIPGGVSRKTYSEHMRDVIMAMFGISHTLHTPVGNDFIRGVSGGERKRVTIAEAALSAAPLQCWDNSTRGLDSANAIEFCRTVRMSTDLSSTTAAVAIYQSPQSAYDIFDKVLVLYEGHQIYFGRAGDAQAFFEEMGFECPDRQTVPDFLTSMTSPQERRVRTGFEGKTPRTPEEFAARWKSSADYARLQEELKQYDTDYPVDGDRLKQFQASRRAQQSKWQRVGSAYTLSYWGQIMLCLRRGFWRLKGDPSVTLTQLFGNGIMALIIASVFYNLQPDTNSFFSRGAILFFAILLNAFGSSLEILTLYAQRPIVEKHTRYAFYHPSCEAFASMLTDMPYKILNAVVFNIALYFLVNLRREPGAFFFYLLVGFILTLAMSMLFRTIASVSRTLSQAMAPAAVLTLGIVMYTGFAMPVPYMRGWARWMQYIDVVSFAFESLMVNEFYGRNFTCSLFVPTGPGYDNVQPLQHVCSTVGAVAGSDIVDGGVYIATLYQYYHSHKWRNLGIVIVFMIGLCVVYLAATEYITAKKSKGEVLVFRRGHQPASLTKTTPDDMEAATGRPVSMAKPEKNLETTAAIRKQTAIFHWQDVCYDIKVKGGPRRILDHVDGWVRPGTLTALMGVSGAGKTTLLDCLASRTTFGVISGEMLVDGRQRDTSFQRKTGYVQQQDLHLATSTVREALVFSALLRQPATIPRKEQIAYVDEVIKLLDMEEYADAVVGVPGEGLNVEQRKRLTIGVELAAKPELLLFLDEPTSGLDSQTSWAICDLMEKLTRNGVSILCTIHQPSAMLFQRFDRLLFLQRGGQTVYFGEVGKDAAILREYFESNGAPDCPAGANPAEWMMEITGAAPGSVADKDWFSVWRNSPQYAVVQTELERLKIERPKETPPSTQANDKTSYREFAAHFPKQFLEVTKRVFEQYWRTPSYIYSKLLLSASSSIYIGFSFYNEGTSLQGLQNQMFAIFMLFLIFLNFVQQIMPHFVTQRSLYEARERPSKTYSWKAFMLSNILVELPWNCLMGVIIFFCWYYPIGLYKNAEYTDTVSERGALMFLLALQFILFASTFTDMIIAAIPTAETAGNVAQLLFSLTLIFCGVLASPTALPGFWIFMYRLSPLNYLTSAMLATGLANAPVQCAANEILRFNPPQSQTCQEYMSSYIAVAGGYLENPNSTSQCRFCSASSTNTFLTAVSANYADRWRNFGILWAYIIFNVAAAIFLYWAFRVPKDEKKRRKEIQAEKKGKRRSMLANDSSGVDEKEKDMAV